jgi:hypothetical protein
MLVDAKSIVQTGNLALGVAGTDQAMLNIKAGAVYDFTADGSISLDGTGHIANAGLFEKTAGTGTSTIAPMLANTGTVEAINGTLDLQDLVNNGTVLAQGGQIVIGNRVTANAGMTGTLEIGAGSTLTLSNGAAANETVDFLGSTGKLTINAAGGAFSAPIVGFTGADTVNITGKTVTGLQVATSSTQAVVKAMDGTTTVETLVFKGNYVGHTFTLSTDAHGGYDIVDPLLHGAAPAAMQFMAAPETGSITPRFADLLGAAGSTAPQWLIPDQPHGTSWAPDPVSSFAGAFDIAPPQSALDLYVHSGG